uniref:GT23 domain-containing protein n=1 Tax=Ciona savignyi TaxID=51511 RepID=H2YDU4_CIOSA
MFADIGLTSFYDYEKLPVAKSVVERGKLTRDVRNDMIDMWKAVQHDFVKLKTLHDKTEGHILAKERLKNRYLAIDIKMENLQNFDSDWQAKASNKMALEIKNRVNNLQNPQKCTDFGQLFVHVENCGFGCIMHDCLFKLNMAFSYNKTLILHTSNSVYLKSNNMSDYLQPVSDTCPKPAKGKWIQPETFPEMAATKHCYIQSETSGLPNAFRY